jgi:DNA-binding IscR family transcriptional regulator
VFSTAELAEELGLPRNHLAKIIQKLAQMGIVETRRGGGGGAILARRPIRFLWEKPFAGLRRDKRWWIV